MTLLILETGIAPDPLPRQFGRYPDMFRDLLDPPALTVVPVLEGALPDTLAGVSGILITGSPAGVYDSDPWIQPLMACLRSVPDTVPMVGICFGHQVMAQAFGGQVEKSDKGWGLGLHRYAVHYGPWAEETASLALPVSHQDQVVVCPPDAEITVSSDFTPYAGLSYRSRKAISFQGHPEFTPDFARALIEARRGSRFSADFADSAINSLEAPNDSHRAGRWIRDFLRGEV